MYCITIFHDTFVDFGLQYSQTYFCFERKLILPHH